MIALVVLIALVIGAFLIPRRFDPAIRLKEVVERPPSDEMRACKGCGDTYHKSWGTLCPNCSGAD